VRILDGTDNAIPTPHLRYIQEDLRVLQATEVASYWISHRNPAQRVQWTGFSLYVATDCGLLTYEASAGWNEPFTPVDGPPAEAWNIDGSFVPWSEVKGLSVLVGTEWVAQEADRRPRRRVEIGHPHVDLLEPRPGWNLPGSDQTAWRAFLQACLELACAVTPLAPKAELKGRGN